MAWIAALISAGAGGLMAANANSAQKKALGNAGMLDRKGYQNALSNLSDYSGVGKEGLYSLAQLMGLEGYRTKAEQDYTDFLKTKPTAPGGVKPSYDSKRDWLTGGPQREILGDNLANALSPNTVQMNLLAPGLGGAVTKSVFGNSDKKAEMAALLAKKKNAENLAKYNSDMAAWEQKRATLEQAKNDSLTNYDPMAALRNTPGYMDRYNEGLNTAKNSMAGSMLSGNALRALTDYGQTFASNEFNNEFNRRASLAGMGQNASTTSGNWSIGQGSNAANLAMMQGQNNANYYGNLNNIAQGTIGNYLAYSNRPNYSNYSNGLYSGGGYSGYSNPYAPSGWTTYGTSEGE